MGLLAAMTSFPFAGAGAPPPRDWNAIVRDANWLPYSYNPRTKDLTFAHVPREAHRAAVFLDARFIANAPQTPPVKISDLPGDAVRESAGPLHFIFHSSFCCSTLLTRALDLPGVSMGLKEPSVLLSLAESAADPDPEASRTILDLLSRPLAPGETQIVKPSNMANLLAPLVLRARTDAKLLLMHSSLETFLRAIARRGMDGRGFARSMYQRFAPSISLGTSFTTDQLLLQTDLQIAAQAWMMQAQLFADLREQFPDRFALLSSDALLSQKPQTLARVGAFFALPQQDWDAIANGPVFSGHAKEHGRPFDAEAYKQQNTSANAASDIAEIMQWAAAFSRQYRAPLTLPDTL